METLRNVRPARLLGAGLIIGALGVISLSMTPKANESDDGFIPLRYKLNPQSPGKLTLPFIAHWTDPHYLGIELSPGSGDKDVDQYISALNRFDIDDSLKPKFDVSWRIFSDGTLIDSGDGHRGHYGEVGHTFTLDRFNAEAGKSYVLEFTIGKNFLPLMKSSPMLEIGDDHAATSEGLALGRDMWSAARLPTAYALFSASLVLIAFGGILLMLQRSNRPKEDNKNYPHITR